MIGGRIIKTNDATAILSRFLLLPLVISAISAEDPQSYSPPCKVRDRSSSSASFLHRKIRSLLDQLLSAALSRPPHFFIR